MATDMNIHNTNKVTIHQKKFPSFYVIHLKVEGQDDTHTLKIFSKEELAFQCEEGMSITEKGITFENIELSVEVEE